MLKKVETIKTTYTLNQLIGGLTEGWLKQFGSLPEKKCIGVLYAQNALETGGTVSMWCNNIGNVKAVDSPNSIVEYCALNGVWEIINGKRVILSVSDPGSWFRAFPTLAEGVSHHLDFLKNHRYKNAWVAVENGDPAAFAHLLKVAGYYTAPESDYVKLMKYYFDKFMKDTTFENVISTLAVPGPEIPVMELDQPVSHTIEEAPRELVVTPSQQQIEAPLKLDWLSQLFNLVMTILNLFIKKK